MESVYRNSLVSLGSRSDRVCFFSGALRGNEIYRGCDDGNSFDKLNIFCDGGSNIKIDETREKFREY